MRFCARFWVVFCIAIVASAAEPELVTLRKAAESGDHQAQKKLGDLYERQFKPAEAEFWYRKAVTTGDPDVLWSLGKLYLHGRGKMSGSAPVAANVPNAIGLLTLAAAQGHKRSQEDLALLYFTGMIVPKNKVEAYKYFRINGQQTAKSSVDSLALELTSVEIQRAEKEVASFKPKSFPDAFADFTHERLELQGIIGSKEKRIAVINDKMLQQGKTAELEMAGLPVQLRCDRVDSRLAEVSFLGRKITLALK